MSWELGYYIFLILIVYFLAITTYKIKDIYLFILLLSYSVIIRYSGFDIDMVIYAENLSSPSLQEKLLIPYFVKEWAYWIVSTILFNIFHKEEIVFIFYDIISITLIMKIAKKMNIPSYFILLFILFFPSLMGMQNVYRQFLSTVFLLYGIILLEKNKKWGLLNFLVAGFIHNVAFLFFPLFFIKRKFLFFISTLFVLFIVLPKALGTKSISSTGLDLTYIYSVIHFFILIFIMLSFKFKPHNREMKILLIASYGFVLILRSILLMGDAQSERIGMIVLQLLLPYICFIIEDKYSNKILVRLLLITVLILPTFLFSSALDMLKT